MGSAVVNFAWVHLGHRRLDTTSCSWSSRGQRGGNAGVEVRLRTGGWGLVAFSERFEAIGDMVQRLKIMNVSSSRGEEYSGRARTRYLSWSAKPRRASAWGRHDGCQLKIELFNGTSIYVLYWQSNCNCNYDRVQSKVAGCSAVRCGLVVLGWVLCKEWS